jgi:putative hydrolase of the HAD superfamily
MPLIRWIAFDAVGTLIHPEPSVAAVYHRVAVRHGSRLALEEVTQRFERAFAQAEAPSALSCGCDQAAQPWHTCEAREVLRWRTIVKHVISDVDSLESCFQELFAHFGQPASWRCFPEVGKTVARLHEAGLRLAVCSNFDRRLHAVMDGLPALAPVELRIVSSEIGHRKPSAAFFDALLAATGCPPSQVLFVGDDPTNDLQAARAAGLPALQIDRKGTLQENRPLRSLAEIFQRMKEESERMKDEG